MKVGILTWHQAINHGAILQTYASCKVVKELGYEPIVLEYDWNIYKGSKLDYLKKIIKLTPQRLLWRIKITEFTKVKKKLFTNFISMYVPIGEHYRKEHDLGAVYIGSDMVFDIIEGYNPYMYGKSVNSPYIFSYAASFGYTTWKMICESGHKNEIKSYLSKFQSIGYRDENTKIILDKLLLDNPKEENIDPVLCYGFINEIEEWDTGKWKKENYILIYSYQSMMEDQLTVNEIRKIAKETGCTVISCGYYHKWCDESINASPTEFLELFKWAKFIVTDTFHGTVFSLVLHKNFTSVIRKNGFKVTNLLEKTGLINRIATTPRKIGSILSEPVNYETYNAWLTTERKKNYDYIDRNLKNAKESELQ